MNYIFLIRGSQKTRNLMRLQIMGSLLVVKIFESLNNRENANGSYVIWGGGGNLPPPGSFLLQFKNGWR